MINTRTSYDRGVNTFSPEGRLYQVEYAIKAISLGSCAIGIKTSEGVVLAVEKRLTSTLVEPSSIEKVFEVDKHVGAAISGLISDARTLIDLARVECQNHRFTFDEPLRVESLTQALCDIAMSFGEGGKDKKVKMSRPFGVSLLLAGIDDVKGPQLFHTDPSGTYVEYKAHAIGSGAEGAVSVLQEKYTPQMTLDQAKALATRVLADTMEEKLSATNFEMVTVTKGEGYRLLHPTELAPIIERAVAEAAAELS